MLTHLQIRDFAIVESVELELASGFTALTGETGAGKSILVDALLLAIGGRADSDAVRHGAARAEITASFELQPGSAAVLWLEEQAIDVGPECVLRRQVGADGRSRAWINGQAIPVQSLRALGELLLDVHGQLEFQSLTRRGYQRELLDACGAAAEVAAVAAAHASWNGLRMQREALLAHTSERDSRLELLEHYRAELGALAAQSGEAEALLLERRRVAALGRLAQGTAQLAVALGDEGAAPALARAQTLARSLLSLDPALEETARLIDEAAVACGEANASLRHYAETLDADPARQEWLESRLAAMESLARKHRVEVSALPEFAERLAGELAQVRHAASDLAGLEQGLASALQAYRASSDRLGARRRAIAGALDHQVGGMLDGLGMPGGRFETRIGGRANAEPSASGDDELEFLVSANPGQPLRPLAKVASGGELSRISLALQVATLSGGRRPCLVFDEVDTGVGGAVADMVGRQLRALAATGQVLCVTHLPQVAAQADHQFRVSKHSDGATTRTRIEALDFETRVEELARMLGGASVTARAREHAREMLQPASRQPAAPPPDRAAPSRAARGAGSSRARNARAESASDR